MTKPDGLAATQPVVIAPIHEPSSRPRRTAAKSPPAMGKLGCAREAVRDFLVFEFQAREVRITKIGPSTEDPQGWYAEAEILVADLGIKTLGLPLSQEVLERELCAIDLDCDMTVKSYEVLDLRDR